MFTTEDLKLFESKGISKIQVENQLDSFQKGFPFLTIIKAAAYEQGISKVSEAEAENLKALWDQYLQGENTILKFVPASGAASRMFKDIFEFADGENTVPTKKAEIQFFEGLKNFAFYDELDKKCIEVLGKNIETLIEEGNFRSVASMLLKKEGLNYGNLPKGLLLFHSYLNEIRTPLQEHLVEGVLYAMNKENQVNIHFTVSKEHRELFENHLNEVKAGYEKLFNSKIQVSFSEQKPSTDTVAGDEHNHPFREEDGSIVFRPGGHGALIENLNDQDADIIFIKNIDNVVPDQLKQATTDYKKIIAGKLVEVQTKIFDYLNKLEVSLVSDAELKEMLAFNETVLVNLKEEIGKASQTEQIEYLKTKFNRPIRVCGMVKNTGEPGGGPFLTVNSDGTVSTQILESSQIDLSNPAEKEKMMNSSHFNPVDLVCAVKNYKGEKFNLLEYTDPATGFISSKSKNGKELKALELPGLWNGAMSNWNTLFVEVPIETFNPVKTVNDLLRTEHQ